MDLTRSDNGPAEEGSMEQAHMQEHWLEAVQA